MKNKTKKPKTMSLPRAYLKAGGYVVFFVSSLVVYYVVGDVYQYVKRKLLYG